MACGLSMAGQMSSANAVGVNVWMRRRGRTRAFSGLASASALWFAAMALAVVVDADTIGAAVGGVPLAGMACVAAAFAHRIARAGLWMAPDGIVVRGPVRSWSLSVHEADGFAVGIQQSIGNGTACPMLQRADGHPIGVWALGREGLVWRFPRHVRELEPLCGELNRILESLRTPPDAPAGARHRVRHLRLA